MAGKLEPLAMEPPEVVEETEEAEGQTKPLKVPEDLLAMVKKLHKEGSLEPQIEDLINRINELQQEEIQGGNGRGPSSLGEPAQGTGLLGTGDPPAALPEEGRWSSEMLKQRLTWEIRALQSSQEQLLTEEKLARDKLREVERRLRSPPEVGGARMVNDGRRRWRYSRGRRLPQTVAPQRTRPAKERPAPSAPAPAARTWSRPQTHRTRPAPSPHAPPSKATGNKGADFGPSSTSSFSLFSNSCFTNRG
ncbi:synaptonemal complex central element protein 1-like isoform X7 [Felis catus]|uniref:synaptonemal complex central element protein 1-like isoform X7 n=1 Tax=Felis catus TaxID=9685 RepID=UPI001D19C55F|nr:synaptonemal complex central element protein 1-like isoform X7 [Felis catus]